MDKNNFDQLGFPVNDNSDDFGTTRELNSMTRTPRILPGSRRVTASQK